MMIKGLCAGRSYFIVGLFKAIFKNRAHEEGRFLRRMPLEPAGWAYVSFLRRGYLTPQWHKGKYRNFYIHFSVDPDDISLVRGSTGSYNGMIEFLEVLYDLYGKIVNSFDDAVPLDAPPGSWLPIARISSGSRSSPPWRASFSSNAVCARGPMTTPACCRSCSGACRAASKPGVPLTG